MDVGVLGVNHKTADLSMREAIAREVLWLKENIFAPYPMVILSTCNRVEIYFSAPDLAAAHTHLLSFFRQTIGLIFEQSFYAFFSIDCFFHLCLVTAGLDSAILAESEIQKQVKDAYRQASHLPSSLHYIFQKALRVSKENRSKGGGLYRALWQMTSWEGRKILIVGFSQINRGLMHFLLCKGIREMTLCTQQKVCMEGIRVGDRSLLKEWSRYDILVSATQSEDYLIRGGGIRQPVIFDLGVPRNVDPEARATIYNIEEIHNWIAQHGEKMALADHKLAIWSHVVRLYRIYRLKTQRALESAGTGSHREYFPSL